MLESNLPLFNRVEPVTMHEDAMGILDGTPASDSAKADFTARIK